MSDVDRAMEMERRSSGIMQSDVDKAMEMTLERQLAGMRTIEDEKTKMLEFAKLNDALRVIPETKKIKIIII